MQHEIKNLTDNVKRYKSWERNYINKTFAENGKHIGYFGYYMTEHGAVGVKISFTFDRTTFMMSKDENIYIQRFNQVHAVKYAVTLCKEFAERVIEGAYDRGDAD